MIPAIFPPAPANRHPAARVADELLELEWELTLVFERTTDPHRARRALLEARQWMARAVEVLVEAFESPEEAIRLGELADLYAIKVRQLGARCAHCGHDKGDHLVDEPQGCGAGHEPEDTRPPCKCVTFQAPGIYAAPTERPAGDDTEPPPSGERA